MSTFFMELAMLVNDTTHEIADGAFRIEPRWDFFMLKNLR